MSKKRLGKGLGALLPADEVTVEAADLNLRVIDVNVDEVEPNPFQPRKEFDPEQLQELCDSIKEHGVIQPISVRKVNNKYQLVAGERRLRASKLAGLTTVPAVEKEYDDRQMMEIALIENIQREDLNPMEEAFAYKSLMDQFELTQEEVSNRVSKSRSAIANTLRLLNLPELIQEYVSRETISMGHARALLGLANEQEMLEICAKSISEGFTVRQLEDYIKDVKTKRKQEKDKKPILEKNESLLIQEERLKEWLGAKVKIEANDKRSRILIECNNPDDLQRVIKLIEEK